MTRKKHNANPIDLKALVTEDQDFLKTLMKQALQEVLETEMTELLGAGPHERHGHRQGVHLPIEVPITPNCLYCAPKN